jgi:hypothetical protein
VEYAASAEYLQKTQGPVTLSYTMPFDGFATLVIDDAQGHRVKNVIGMAPRTKGKQTDLWDGTDDQGKLMPPGTYKMRGLMHAGIDPVYEAGYGSSGVPPWETADGSGGWMSDHNPNVAVAAGKEMMLLAASGCEGGRALVGADFNGRRKWGETKFQGIAAVAADDRYAYAGMNGGHGWGVKDPSIGRLLLADGKYAPFATQPEPQLMVPVATQEEKATVRGLAVSANRLAVALAGPDVVRFYSPATSGATSTTTARCRPRSARPPSRISTAVIGGGTGWTIGSTSIPAPAATAPRPFAPFRWPGGPRPGRPPGI